MRVLVFIIIVAGVAVLVGWEAYQGGLALTARLREGKSQNHGYQQRRAGGAAEDRKLPCRFSKAPTASRRSSVSLAGLDWERVC